MARHRTAITRDRLSVGARSAHDDELLAQQTVLDYGCGRGDDVENLRRLGQQVVGWDPHYSPTPQCPFRDVVLLTYVLNTIEDRDEREATLRAAWGRARRLLVVTVRLVWERSKVRGEQYADGVLTSRGTFQHLFTVAELTAIATAETQRRAVVARPGVVYVFRSDEDRIRYLSRRYSFEASSSLEDFSASLAFYERRGRLPEAAHGADASRAKALNVALRRSADPHQVSKAREALTLNLLLFLAMERFHGHMPWESLSAGMQADIRAAFGSYKHATWRAHRLLGQLRDDVVLRRTMRASVGKLSPTALYVHRRALATLPVLLRIYEECGALVAGRPEDWHVVKLHHDRRMISWLSYPQFDKDPHPRLTGSHHVDLASLGSGYTDYSRSTNPPVLHRKEEFLSPEDRRHNIYSRLTAQEVRAGLYEHPERIGTAEGWQQELDRCHRALRGHRLVNVPARLAPSEPQHPASPSGGTSSS